MHRVFRRLLLLLQSTTSSLPCRVQLLEAECPGGERRTVGFAGQVSDLTGQAHHGRFDVQVG
jgi:hypothetical protein